MNNNNIVFIKIVPWGQSVAADEQNPVCFFVIHYC